MSRKQIQAGIDDLTEIIDETIPYYCRGIYSYGPNDADIPYDIYTVIVFELSRDEYV